VSRTRVPRELAERVASQAGHQCGYCRTQERIVGAAMEVDHIVPEAAGGPTEETNLWLACTPCNRHKSGRLDAIDAATGERTPLFNPRP